VWGKSEIRVCILGENRAQGKNFVARAIHEKSPTREIAFITLELCGGSRRVNRIGTASDTKRVVSPELRDATWENFEQAEGGTLFLDEIGRT